MLVCFYVYREALKVFIGLGQTSKMAVGRRCGFPFCSSTTTKLLTTAMIMAYCYAVVKIRTISSNIKIRTMV